MGRIAEVDFDAPDSYVGDDDDGPYRTKELALEAGWAQAIARIGVHPYRSGQEWEGWDPQKLSGDAYDSPRAARLYAAVGSPGPIDEEYVLAEAQDGSGRWALLGLSVPGHFYAIEEE